MTKEINDKFTKNEGEVTRKYDGWRALATPMESTGLDNIGAALMMPLTDKLSKKDALMYADAVKNAIEATEEKDFLQE
jgi:hypothetical protein